MKDSEAFVDIYKYKEILKFRFCKKLFHKIHIIYVRIAFLTKYVFVYMYIELICYFL